MILQIERRHTDNFVGFNITIAADDGTIVIDFVSDADIQNGGPAVLAVAMERTEKARREYNRRLQVQE